MRLTPYLKTPIAFHEWVADPNSAENEAAWVLLASEKCIPGESSIKETDTPQGMRMLERQEVMVGPGSVARKELGVKYFNQAFRVIGTAEIVSKQGRLLGYKVTMRALLPGEPLVP